MRKLFEKKARVMLGIDISSASVKIVAISVDTHGFCVRGYGCEPLPIGTMESGQIKNVDAVTNAIKLIMTRASLQSREAALAVPDSSAISKIIQINNALTETEIEEMVVMEADKYFPYPIDEISLDFEVLGPSSKHTTMQDVLVVASRAQNISNRVEAVTQAGLTVKIVDVESYAIERVGELLLNRMTNNTADKVVAIIDMGAVYTRFFVMHKSKIIFSREEEFGGKYLIDMLQYHYNMKVDEAIEALEQKKFPDNFDNEILQPFKDQIVMQVKRALQFFMSTGQHPAIDHVFLAGGVAKEPGIAQLVEDSIHIPVEIAQPFEQIDLANTIHKEHLREEAPRLLVACGLALRAS
ncbi:MAG: type IV pilus assembly protein PilM [Legionella sp.]